MIDLHNIHSLTDFRQNTKHYLSQLQSDKNPLVLTVNGAATIVVEDMETFQNNQNRLQILEQELQRVKLEALQRDVEIGIRQIQQGDGVDAEQVFADLRSKSLKLHQQR